MTKISLIPYIGGKYHLITDLLTIINYVQEIYNLQIYVEPTGGGGRCLLNINTKRFIYRHYNDGDYGLVNLFRCLQDDELTQQMIQTLFELDYTREEFERIKEERKDTKTNIYKSAAYTYAVAKLSRAADMKSFNREKYDKNNIINYFSNIRKLKSYKQILKGVQCTNLDGIELIEKYKDNQNVLIYLDPDYDNESKATQKDTYSLSFDHDKAIDLLIETKAKVILSGYHTDKYDPLRERGWHKHLIKNIPRSSSNKKGDRVDEYIWVNFEIPEYLLTKQQVDKWKSEN